MIEKPPWLRKKLPIGSMVSGMVDGMEKNRLFTICREACCPNQGECFSKGTATFLIMGNVCTRNCAFCAVAHGIPGRIDAGEPERIAREIERLKLSFVVITSVTRDDLPDGGAQCFSDVIRAIRKQCPGVGIEVLIPDFQGDPSALARVLDAGPDVLNHNVETVPRLYPRVRPRAVYERSLRLLQRAGEIHPSIVTKSGLMVGMGESGEEMERVMKDLHAARCDSLTIGQYLCPSATHFPVVEYIRPEMFEEYERMALEIGFKSVVASPFVRSSYMAEASYRQAMGYRKKS
ncbi:lipoyl synthase [Desulfatirhabdium butyrativorans]|uniref:lipoyl synthase n=1 Tax=Desulfatirhabdium butyrativorans TaxID=340467 RepID=UPI0003FC3CD6|nr:lipoyl synthase [Desulfatirhabdium butyrativorans]